MLRANRPAPQQPVAAPPAQPVAQQPVAAPPAQPVAQQPVAAPPASTPAVQQSTAVANPNAKVSIADMNQGILDNMDGAGESGNYVTVDGSEFFYKATDQRATVVNIVVSYGKRFYQWVDETDPNSKQFYNSDTKLNDNYKLKMEIRWLEAGETEGDEPVEFTMSLSTTSAMQFIDYAKNLAKAGYGVGQVWSQMTISRHARQGSTDRYSRVDFEAFDLETAQPLGIKSVAQKK